MNSGISDGAQQGDQPAIIWDISLGFEPAMQVTKIFPASRVSSTPRKIHFFLERKYTFAELASLCAPDKIPFPKSFAKAIFRSEQLELR